MSDDIDLGSIDFASAEEAVYFSEAILGEHVKDFLLSDVGRYLHGCAKQEFESCREEALKCNPDRWWGRRKLKALQQKAENAENFMRWCAEAIETGNAASFQLSQLRDQ